MKVGVIGGGAIGLLLSYYLARFHQVTVYARRKEQVNNLRSNGIQLKETGERRHVQSTYSTEYDDEDVFIICVKQLHITTVRSSLEKIKKDTPIIFLQNGMGHIEEIKHLDHPIIVGTVEHGALKINDDTVSHTGKGAINLAGYKGISEGEIGQLIEMLHKPTFVFHQNEDWYTMLANKLIVNAVINPLTAIYRVKNAAIVHNPYINRIAEELCRETADVLQVDFEKSWKKIQQVARNTGKNTSSMLKDILEKRMTEIDGITGYILQKNTAFQLPYSTFIYYSMKAIEEIEGT